jgi:hypothetical protein
LSVVGFIILFSSLTTFERKQPANGHFPFFFLNFTGARNTECVKRVMATKIVNDFFPATMRL